MDLSHLIKLANKFYSNAQDDEVKLINRFIDKHMNFTKAATSYKIANQPLPCIVLCRHGETSLNSSKDRSQERLRAWIDTPLVEEGLLQAEKLSHYFSSFPISKIITSDLIRAQSVAQSIARRNDVPIYLDPGMRPWDMGVNLQGRPVSKYVPVMLEYIKNENDIIDGSSESFKTFQRRCLRVIQNAMDEAIAHPERGIICLIGHSRNCRLLHGWLLAGTKNIDTIDKKPLLDEKDPTPTGGFMAIQFDGQAWKLIDLPNHEIINKK
jgi:broad specificity phosphatase PhoE